jgi:UDP-N-acetylmuramoylalanine--D-glutamate ligase
MEFVDEINGVVFLNDSKATSSAATISALENFNSRNVILLLAGRGKNEDYADLIAQIKRKAKHVIVFGEMVELLRDELKLSDIPYTISENMQNAVLKAFEISEKGDVVLLSPAGASFDMYRNYQERGEHFINMVKLLRGKLLE